ncbi:ankyrin repeat-containing protein [Anaeramoeba flamelloides]|uniref:Ankyrin repeat-containing protein n=1 Tax=Anaeramoeba flamelloides TaxID=1746091 RepID=A0AAV7ZXI9_9EUKA|nr:ankyrin repeat-containing protein [Anaeramoeba flamelloides]
MLSRLRRQSYLMTFGKLIKYINAGFSSPGYVEQLIEKGSDVNEKTKFGTVFHFLCFPKNKSIKPKSFDGILQLLFKNGINLNIQDYNGDTGVHYYFLTRCAQLQHLELFEQAGFNYELQNNSGVSCYHNFLIYKPDLKTAQHLHSQNVDFQSRVSLRLKTSVLERTNLNCVHLVCGSLGGVDLKLLNFLLGCKLSYKGSTGDNETVLHLCCLSHRIHFEVIEFFLGSGVDASQISNFKKNCLEVLLNNAFLEDEQKIKVCKILLDHYKNRGSLAAIKKANRKYCVLALQNSQQLACKLIGLLSLYGFNTEIHDNDNNKNNLLHLYGSKDYYSREGMQYLVDTIGLNPCKCNNKKENALHIISRNITADYVPCAKYLLAKGVDLNLKNYSGQNVVDLITRKASVPQEVLKFLFLSFQNLDQKTHFHPSLFYLTCCQLKLSSSELSSCLKNKRPNLSLTSTTSKTLLYQIFRHKSLTLANLQLLVAHGAQINAQPKRGFSCLNGIIDGLGEGEKLDRSIVDYLIHSGLDVNFINGDHHNYLTQMCHGKVYNIQLLKVLLQNEINANYSHPQFQTAFHILIRQYDNSNESKVECFFKTMILNLKNFNPQVCFSKRSSILILMVRKMGTMDSNILKVCIEKGVNINKVDKKRFHPLHRLCKSLFDNSQAIEYLLKMGVDPNIQTFNKNTPLHFLIRNDYHFEKSFKLLMQYGANLNIKNAKQWTPFHLLINKQTTNFSIIKLFIANGQNINTVTPNGQSLLEKISKLEYNMQNYNFIQFLLNKSAQINLQLKNNSNCFISACYSYPSIQTLDLLIKNGARIDEKNIFGKNALLLLFEKRIINFELIKFLIQKGADVNSKTKKNRSCLLILIIKYFYSII